MFFQDQIYRADGGTVLLPPGEMVMTYGRGPEYKQLERKIIDSQLKLEAGSFRRAANYYVDQIWYNFDVEHQAYANPG